MRPSLPFILLRSSGSGGSISRCSGLARRQHYYSTRSFSAVADSSRPGRVPPAKVILRAKMGDNGNNNNDSSSNSSSTSSNSIASSDTYQNLSLPFASSARGTGDLRHWPAAGTFPHHEHEHAAIQAVPTTSSSSSSPSPIAYQENNPTINTPASYYNEANPRLSLISRHLQTDRDPSSFRLNTPYSIERDSLPEEEFDSHYSIPSEPSFTTLTPPAAHRNQETVAQKDEKNNDSAAAATQSSDSQETSNRAAAVSSPEQDSTKPPPAAKMSAQEPHPTVLIPGPIEYDDQVLKSMGHFSQSHVGQPFVDCFGELLTMLRSVFQTSNPNSQPFVLSGSGTLGWDQIASNLTERGEDALVLHTGYFGDSFADCFEAYGVKATQLKAPIGDRPQLPQIEEALKKNKYKVLTVTHVDTSTGVLSELQNLTKMVRRVSPETLVIVDGVCSVGAEEIRFDDWDLDVVMTASQKALGCPAGLSVVMVSERAMNVFKNRHTPPSSYFASWKNWLPIMQNYEAKKPSYFATPSPQLIHALHTAVSQILARPLSERFARHKAVSDKIKAHVTSLGLKQLASDPANQSCAMTAIYLPEGVAAAEFLPGVLKRGVVFAGGLHKQIATKYIRFGHMGVSVMNPEGADIDKAIKALEERLTEVGWKKP